jgi:pyrroloquinoline-quinone synthase
MLEHYEFIDDHVMAYCLTRAPRDSDFALNYIKAYALSDADQEARIAAVRFKCDVLWAQLDALNHAYVNPGVSPGAFRPREPAFPIQ